MCEDVIFEKSSCKKAAFAFAAFINFLKVLTHLKQEFLNKNFNKHPFCGISFGSNNCATVLKRAANKPNNK